MKPEEIKLHRMQLSQLDQTLRTGAQNGNTFQYCTPLLWKLYDGTNGSGSRIYQSFSNRELLEILTDTAQTLGRAPKQNEIYCVYRQYIRLRFGNWPRALEAAGLRIPRKGRKTVSINQELEEQV